MTQEQILLSVLTGVGATLVMVIFFIGRAWASRGSEGWKARLTPVEIESLEEAMPPPPPKGAADRFDRRFAGLVESSGLDLGVDQVIGLILLCAVGTGAGFYLWRDEPWLALVGFILGLLVPVGALLSMAGRRRRLIQQQMPDAIFLLARSLRAGLGLEQGIHLIAKESAAPLSDELMRVSEQIKLGLTVPVALQSASQRIGVVDFSVFAAVMALQRSTGGQLPTLLDRLAGGVRDRVQYQGHFRSATALGRVTAIALGAAVPLIFLWYVLFQPETVQIFVETPGGVGMLATAFALELVGIIWLYRLLRTDN